jgi:hypothetical protein
MRRSVRENRCRYSESNFDSQRYLVVVYITGQHSGTYVARTHAGGVLANPVMYNGLAFAVNDPLSPRGKKQLELLQIARVTQMQVVITGTGASDSQPTGWGDLESILEVAL